jgi:hypothetical protein
MADGGATTTQRLATRATGQASMAPEKDYWVQGKPHLLQLNIYDCRLSLHGFRARLLSVNLTD